MLRAKKVLFKGGHSHDLTNFATGTRLFQRSDQIPPELQKNLISKGRQSRLLKASKCFPDFCAYVGV